MSEFFIENTGSYILNSPQVYKIRAKIVGQLIE